MRHSTNVVEYLHEFEAIFEKALTRDQGKLFEEKKSRGLKSRVRVPLRISLL
jgi:hypothetical protein